MAEAYRRLIVAYADITLLLIVSWWSIQSGQPIGAIVFRDRP